MPPPMNFYVLDGYVNDILSAMHTGKSYTDAVDKAIKWCYDSVQNEGSYGPYNNLIRDLCHKIAQVDEQAVPRTLRIVYRIETEIYAKKLGNGLTSEADVSYYLLPEYSTGKLARNLCTILKAKSLAEDICQKLDAKFGYHATVVVSTSVDKDVHALDGTCSMSLWVV